MWLGETWKSGRCWLHPHQRGWLIKSTRNSLIQCFISVDHTVITEPALASTVKSSPPLGWNPSRHANNCLDPENYEYTPSNAMPVNLVCWLHLWHILLFNSETNTSHPVMSLLCLQGLAEKLCWVSLERKSCKEFSFLRTWYSLDPLLLAYMEFCFQEMKNILFTQV